MKIRKFNSDGLERWRSFYRDLFMNIRTIAGGKISPKDIIKGYSAMAVSAKAEGSLDPKTKELIATAISVAVRCDGCIASHTKSAGKNGANREEMLEALGIAVYMGGGPSIVYAAQALDAFDQFSEECE